MSFAAGMRAGQLAAEGALGAFRDSRERRNLRLANAEIEALDSALVDPQISPALPQANTLTGEPAPQMPPVQGIDTNQQLTAPPKPKGSEIALRNAEVYRSHGLMDQYKDQLATSNSLAAQEWQQQRALTEDTQWQKDYDLAQRARAESESMTNAQVNEIELKNKLTQFGVENVEAYQKLDGSLTAWQAANPKQDITNFMQTPEWNSADSKAREALASQYYDTTKAQNNVAVQTMKGKLDKHDTLEGMVGVYSADRMLTPEVDYRLSDPNPETGVRDLIAKEGGKEYVVQSGTDDALKGWLYERVESGEAGAAYASQLKATAGEVSREIYQLQTERGKLDAEITDERMKNVTSMLKVLEDAAALNPDHPLWKVYAAMGEGEDDPLKGLSAKANMALFIVQGGMEVPPGRGLDTEPAPTEVVPTETAPAPAATTPAATTPAATTPAATTPAATTDQGRVVGIGPGGAPIINPSNTTQTRRGLREAPSAQGSAQRTVADAPTSVEDAIVDAQDMYNFAKERGNTRMQRNALTTLYELAGGDLPRPLMNELTNLGGPLGN